MIKLPKICYGKVLVIFHLVILLTLNKVIAQDQVNTVTICDTQSGLPLSGVTLISSTGSYTVMADSNGKITIPVFLVDNDEELEITMTGYKTLRLFAGNLRDDSRLLLDPLVKLLDEVVFTNSNALRKVQDIQMGVDVLTAAEAKKLPAILGESDMLKLLQLKPGVKGAGEGLAGFYVRGGGADQNLIMLDGIPVYNPNHLLGVFSVFNNDALKQATLYKSAYPSQYGGRLSSVLDITSRAGSRDSMMISGGVGLLSSRLSLEGPIEKGRSSFIVSARRTYFDVFTKAMNRANEGKEHVQPIPAYYFADLNLRSDWTINKRHTMWATAYVGSDNFHAPADDYSAQFDWGNRTASVNLRSTLTDKAELVSSVFYSGYKYRLGSEDGLNTLMLRSGIDTWGLKVRGRLLTTGDFSWQGGVEGMTHKLVVGDFASDNELAGYESGERAGGNELAAFVNGEWDNGRKLAFSGGLRLSSFHAGKQWYVNPEPRISSRWSINEQSAFKFSYTRMFQYLHLASLSSSSLPVDMWYPSTERTRPQYADQVSFGWSTALNRQRFYLSMEAYYKRMHNQVEFRDGSNLFGNPKIENDFIYGRAQAYGLETYVEKKSGRTTGWLGYTLSWANRKFSDINGGNSFRPRYDRRHDLALVVMHKLNDKFTLSGSWVYGSGAYTTVPVGRYMMQDDVGIRTRSIIPVYTERGNYQLEAVHRLDFSLVMALNSKKGKQDITFSLYNAYSRRNPFYIQFREVGTKDGYITAIEPTLVSLFPVLPGVTYNFRF